MGLDTCEPVYVRTEGTRVSGVKKLCPGYIFVKVDLEIFPVSTLLSLPGVISILKTGSSFYEMPEKIINELCFAVKTKANDCDQKLMTEIEKISAAKTREERETLFLSFLQKHQRRKICQSQKAGITKQLRYV